ncbi:redoxin domain-containing protein [Bacteroides sp. 224]|uniref:TlpA family protein disulfide reductase n=1 Tax=Bacteroides sp. 224 TaxID=2302936 RepID=UPI0013D11EA4|nr:redoxin domain-containing protein [Bacteroides sp. 224]NDV65778.1 hypothetical protein [Bacteroides sp. 224]
MKHLFLLRIFIIGFSLFPVFATYTNAQKNHHFSISGKIEGLMPGDTLLFQKVILPFKMDQEEIAFEVIVNEPDTFFYSGEQPHTQYYLMEYKPISGKYKASSRRALRLIMEEGDYQLKGNTDYIYFSAISGGFYNHPLLKEVLHLEDSLGIIRAGYGKIIDEVRANGDTEKAKEYTDKFNRFHRDHQESYAIIKQKTKELTTNNPSSPWVIVEYLQRVSNASPEEMKSVLSNMSQEAQDSYYGQILKKEVDIIERLMPGNEAPFFSVTTIDGKKITSDDTKGKYLLLYHWGLCPGSIAIDKKVTAFYEKYKDHFSLIGITDNIQIIHKLNKETAEDDEILGMKLKPILENMVTHPWFDVESTGDNHKITEDFAFGGLPYFVFISPEGKILARDFQKAFNKAQEIMKSEFGN